MHELTEICRATRELRLKDEPLWLATVVAVYGSAYRQPGARMLFTRDRVIAGCVSGGCLESEIVRSAGWATRGGPIVRRFDATDEDFAIGKTGCGGCVDILLEQVSDGAHCDMFTFIEQCLSSEARATLATVIETRSPDVNLAERLLFDVRSQNSCTTIQHPLLASELATQVRSAALQRQTREYVPQCVAGVKTLLEVIDPSPALFIFGSGHDALALARLANIVGWSVSVHVRQLRPAVQNRFWRQARLLTCTVAAAVAELNRCARPLAVLMSHDIDADREALCELLPSRARYIGVLGPARRTQRLLQELRTSDKVTSRAESRVYGPAGLHLGAESPMEIALSIVAEARAVLGAASARSLRERRQPIHERADDSPELRIVASGQRL